MDSSQLEEGTVIAELNHINIIPGKVQVEMASKWKGRTVPAESLFFDKTKAK